jgi:16S rRNA (uracil1498-N3)-methyltransferase
MHLFYQPLHKNGNFHLENEEFSHCVKVLRHQKGDTIQLTDGKGTLVQAQITDIDKKKLNYHPLKEEQVPKKPFHIHLMIAPTKQMERMEWMVEKACELGIDQITFLYTQNSERPSIKLERLEKKAVSALKQSKGAYKTILEKMLPLEQVITTETTNQKFIAIVKNGLPHLIRQAEPNSSISLLIGPEGDFTNEELTLTEKYGFQPISLGNRVLRTETAGLIAVTLVNAVNGY